MGLRMLLVEDGKILCEVPLSPKDWLKEDLEKEYERLEEDLREISRVFEVFTNVSRVRMMRSLMEDEDFMLSFKDFMEELDMNPKSVREHAARLFEAGFLERPSRGKYRLSELGRLGFMMGGLAMKRMLRALEDEWLG